MQLGIIEWILGKRDAKWSSFLSRDVLEHANRYVEYDIDGSSKQYKWVQRYSVFERMAQI